MSDSEEDLLGTVTCSENECRDNQISAFIIEKSTFTSLFT